jgi:hypothetical protein
MWRVNTVLSPSTKIDVDFEIRDYFLALLFVLLHCYNVGDCELLRHISCQGRRLAAVNSPRSCKLSSDVNNADFRITAKYFQVGGNHLSLRSRYPYIDSPNALLCVRFCCT